MNLTVLQWGYSLQWFYSLNTIQDNLSKTKTSLIEYTDYRKKKLWYPYLDHKKKANINYELDSKDLKDV